jgi:cobalt-zinc-cadmium efflux system outer membrane protein
MPVRSAIAVLALAVALGLPPGLCAQVPEPASLDGLVEEALANNPDLQAAGEQAAAAEARPEQARALADPVVSLQYTNDGWSPTLGEREMTTLAFMGSQTLPWPGKRGLRGALAAKDAAQARLRIERARLGLAASVKRAYWALALARETLELLGEQAQAWRETEAVARARYAVGQGAQQDVLRAQVEITRYEQRRAAQEAEIEVRTVELNRLLGRSLNAPAPPVARLALRPQPLDAPALEARAEALSPVLRSAGLAREREQLAAQLAGRDFRPDLTLQAGYMTRGGLDPMWQAGVGVNLPVVRGRRRAAVAEAEALGRAAARQADAVREQLRYRTRERLAQLRAAETLARLYSDGVVPQARLAYESSIASYQSGRVPFLAVLEALSGLYADRAGHLGVLAAHERTRAALEEASLEATSEMPVAGAAAAGMAGAAAAAAAMTPVGAAPAGSSPAAAGMGTMGQ